MTPNASNAVTPMDTGTMPPVQQYQHDLRLPRICWNLILSSSMAKDMYVVCYVCTLSTSGCFCTINCIVLNCMHLYTVRSVMKRKTNTPMWLSTHVHVIKYNLLYMLCMHGVCMYACIIYLSTANKAYTLALSPSHCVGEWINLGSTPEEGDK
jgi:hypothetical protein